MTSSKVSRSNSASRRMIPAEYQEIELVKFGDQILNALDVADVEPGDLKAVARLIRDFVGAGRPAATTRQPASANPPAMAAPMPAVPPVTNADRPEKSNI